MCSGRVFNSCSTSDTRRVNLVTNPVISHEREKYREVFTTSGTYPWSFVTQIFLNGEPSRGGDRKLRRKFQTCIDTSSDKRKGVNYRIRFGVRRILLNHSTLYNAYNIIFH